MGEVYKAYDTHRERDVALKLLPQDLSGDEEYLRRFKRESHVAARLREQHVIPVYDYGEIDDRLFIVMRLVDGTDLGALLQEDGRIAPQRAVDLVGQVAEALDAAHADHLVHRDIRPSNILVTSSDFVYVVDFGIARPVGGRQAADATTGPAVGTLNYMAPERFADDAVDGRSDVYSLACVLYECLTGVPPFTGKDLPTLIYAHLYTSPPQASATAEGTGPALDEVIARGMAKDPADRFPTAGLLVEAAREALLNPSPTPPVTESLAPAQNQAPIPVWEAAIAAWQDVAEPPALAPQSADDRLVMGASDSPTQTMSIASDDNWLGTGPLEYTPPGMIPGPDYGPLPPDEEEIDQPAREPRRRRLGLLIVAAVAAVGVGVAVALIFTGSAKPNPGGTASVNPAGTVSSAPAATASATPSVAAPTVAGKIEVGGTPSYVQVAPNGKFAYITNPGSGEITVLNTADDQVSGIIKIPQGPPQFVSFSPDSQTAYVSVYTTGKNAVHLVAFVNTATSIVTSTVSVNNHTPGPSTASPDGRYLYVPNHNMEMTGSSVNIIDVINTVTRQLAGEIAVEPNPHWIVFGKGNGLFYATDHMSTVITVVNAATNRIVKTIEVGETPHSIAISPDGSHLAITSFSGNEVFIVDTATETELATIPVGRNPLEIAYSPDGRYIYTADYEDNTITAIDAADNRVIAEVPAGKAPASISVLPNGHQAYVSDEGDGTIEVLNLPN
jgi:YVTN family beta-propeller protein